jgi:HAD superfamily hydrolase (TIGR01458 family)
MLWRRAASQNISCRKAQRNDVSSTRSEFQAFLIDLDGVLYVGKEPITGAKECLRHMDELGYSYRFVSNSTRRCRKSVADRLNGLGYNIPSTLIFTPPLAAIEHMKREHKNRCFLLTTGDVHRDFKNAGLHICEDDVDFVIIGDAADGFTFERLNQALQMILDGAEILALEMDRYWREPDGMVLSAGPFVTALEYATGKKAQLMGKPSSQFFQMALDDLGIRPEDAAMIGDDIQTDVHGAQEMGMKGILVRTGKYREDLAKSLNIAPDMVLDSLAQLSQLL